MAEDKGFSPVVAVVIVGALYVLDVAYHCVGDGAVDPAPLSQLLQSLMAHSAGVFCRGVADVEFGEVFRVLATADLPGAVHYPFPVEGALF